VSGRGARAAQWLWRSRSPGALLARLALVPVAGAYRLAVLARNAAYDAGLLKSGPLAAPSVGIGNLSVGGTGKTPLTMHVAGSLARRGLHPGIVLRGYGGDETAEHRQALPHAVVEAEPDRHAAAARAVGRGADVLVLDDCLQRRSVVPDVMLGVVSVESWEPPFWPLPAGPWREGLAGLRRTDAVIVTRKVCTQVEAETLAARLAPFTKSRQGIVAALEPVSLGAIEGGGPLRPLAVLKNRDVVAVAGIGEPETLAVPMERLGARVRLLSFGDHHAYTADEVAWIIRTLPLGGVVVTTAKDAVKLAPLWPVDGPECLVAKLEVTITAGAQALEDLLERAATAARRKNPGTAAAPSARES
jgi:tetraacyldisaccharide 4'-kinase